MTCFAKYIHFLVLKIMQIWRCKLRMLRNQWLRVWFKVAVRVVKSYRKYWWYWSTFFSGEKSEFNNFINLFIIAL